MAYGDQPALVCELVDWARATGFEVTAAGKGMNFEPRYRYFAPDTVWGLFDWTEEQVAADNLIHGDGGGKADFVLPIRANKCE